MNTFTANDVQKASRIHDKNIVINAAEATHLDEFDSHFTKKLEIGGVTGVVITVNWPDDTFQDAVEHTEEWYEQLDEIRPNNVIVATKIEDIISAKRRNKAAVILAFQNAKPMQENLQHIRIFHRLGIRMATLTYQGRNNFGDGCGERSDAGLSNMGVKAVENMNEAGMIVDLSHVGYRTSLDVIEVSRDPVIFSHSAVWSICPHIRNVKDDQMTLVAEKDGVIGVPGATSFLTSKTRKGSTLDDYLKHVEYIIDHIGIEHVGIGTDIREEEKSGGRTWMKLAKWAESHPELGSFVSIPRKLRYPKGIGDVSETENITRALVTKGYSDNEIEKVLGGNFLRVFKRVWRN
ncbi:MAG: hypothetical protein CMO12_02690 [Thaumarchaeota archaeon]|nr:hypothetical protein [Nitrososphaerota archaeon]